MEGQDTKDSKPILGYYKLRGWVGSIRLLLAYLEIDYEDKLYPVPSPETCQGQWGFEKQLLGLDFPNLPYWIQGSIKLTETKCILKHIAGHFDSKLLGNSTSESGRANMLEDVLWDMWISLANIAKHHDEESKRIFLQEASKTLGNLDIFLSKNKWAVGPDMTYVDFLLYEVLIHHFKFEPNLLNNFHHCIQFLKNFEAIPTIRRYMNSDNFISGPCYSYKFKAKL